LPRYNNNEAYADALNNGDLQAIIKLYADDARVKNSDGSMVSGLENIKEQYAVFLKTEHTS
jgi:ketosteroid isomerase-like protein